MEVQSTYKSLIIALEAIQKRGANYIPSTTHTEYTLHTKWLQQLNLPPLRYREEIIYITQFLKVYEMVQTN